MIRQELVAQELKSLIGWGATPQGVLSRPTLRDLVAETHSVEHHLLAELIRKELERAAGRLPLPQGRAALILLRLSNEATKNTTINRETAIGLLGLHVGVETFRRPLGPELDLMRALARSLLADSKPQSWQVAECVVSSASGFLELRLQLREL